MASDRFNRYMWLVDTIYRAGHISFADINSRWLRSAVTDGREIPLRTFHNHRKAVEEMFNITIACDKSTNEYYIEHKSDIAENRLAQWLLDCFAAGNMVQENRDISDRIATERIPSAQQWLAEILTAMRANRMLSVVYRSFRAEQVSELLLQPYFVKVYDRRWYVYARSASDATIKVYALDRIEQLEVTDRCFELPAEFLASEHLATSIGITTFPNIPPQRIVLKCTGLQPQYLRALPLHDSQSEEETHADYSLFSYLLSPTDEFYRRILAHREYIEIVAPLKVREEFADILRQMLEHYN